MNKTIAIITGASSGLGRQFVYTVVKEYPSLDEIWVIARRQDRLLELKENIQGIAILPLALDLTEDNSFQILQELLEQQKPLVKLLINNAGYVKTGYFEDISKDSINNTILLNIKALTLLQQLVLPYMRPGCFSILVSSACSFAPIVGQAVYSASKKYVYNLGRALKEELAPRGINILVLCCGNMDTEMNPKASMHAIGALLPFLDLKELTRSALKRAEAGCGVYTMGIHYKLLRIIGKIMPSSLIMKITKRFFP